MYSSKTNIVTSQKHRECTKLLIIINSKINFMENKIFEEKPSRHLPEAYSTTNGFWSTWNVLRMWQQGHLVRSMEIMKSDKGQGSFTYGFEAGRASGVSHLPVTPSSSLPLSPTLALEWLLPPWTHWNNHHHKFGKMWQDHLLKKSCWIQCIFKMAINVRMTNARDTNPMSINFQMDKNLSVGPHCSTQRWF